MASMMIGIGTGRWRWAISMIIRKEPTAKPTAALRFLSRRSLSLASLSPLSSPAIPRYWYPASSIAALISATEAILGL